jgi:hypothetical protein
MAITHSALGRSGSVVSASQSRKGLTERLTCSPQVRLVFGEELPQFADANGNFVNP